MMARSLFGLLGAAPGGKERAEVSSFVDRIVPSPSPSPPPPDAVPRRGASTGEREVAEAVMPGAATVPKPFPAQLVSQVPRSRGCCVGRRRHHGLRRLPRRALEEDPVHHHGPWPSTPIFTGTGVERARRCAGERTGPSSEGRDPRPFTEPGCAGLRPCGGGLSGRGRRSGGRSRFRVAVACVARGWCFAVAARRRGQLGCPRRHRSWRVRRGAACGTRHGRAG